MKAPLSSMKAPLSTVKAPLSTMKAPLLLLPLLLLGVNSQDVASASPELATTTIKVKDPSLGDPPSTSAMSHSTVPGATSASKLGNPLPTTVIPTTTDQKIMATSSSRNSPSTLVVSPTKVQVTTLPNNLQNSPPNPMTSSFPQQVISSTSSGAAGDTPAATSGVTQQKTSPSASLGSSTATTAANPVLTHVSNPPTIPGGLGIAATSSTMEPHRSQPLDQLSSTTMSTGVPRSNLPPEIKDYGTYSTTSAAKQAHSSSSSPAQGPDSSTRPGSISTSVTPFDASVSHTSGKASPSLPPSSIDKVSEAATTLTPGAAHRSPDASSAPTKPASSDWSPASAQPSAPTPGDHTASSQPGHQHPNASLRNEVVCKDQVQNNWPTMYLKEAKTCAEWTIASANISFFESFCSTGQHTFNASREACTVILTSREPQSQQWAVQAVVHIPLDPEKVLEELKEKDKLEELGIANITYEKIEREMIINDEFSTPLIITIVTLAGSLLLIAAIYGCCHQRFSQKKDQQRLTEELQTMENGYHDNPTLEVMETSSEMQEKKVNLNGELGDSWIVPLDTLMKEDLEEEEDTHL